MSFAVPSPTTATFYSSEEIPGDKRHESISRSFYECVLSLSYPADRALTIDSKLAFRTKLSIETVSRFVIIFADHIPLCVITYLLLENNTVQYLFIKTRQAMYV
jgi:hypothetical protein